MPLYHIRIFDKYHVLAGVTVIVVIQLLFAGGILKYPDVVPIPPVRVSIVVVSQLLIGLTVGSWIRTSRVRLLRYCGLLSVLYVFALWFVLRQRVSGVAVVVHPAVRVEAVVSVVLLVGFALMNVVLLARVARDETREDRLRSISDAMKE